MKKILITSILLLNALFAFSQVTYQYDNLYRLQKVEYPNGVKVEYTYDELGNRQTKTVSGTIAVTGVNLNKSAITLSVNGTEQLTATVQPSNATNKSVTWSSDNTSVATVNKNNGLVTGIAAGTAIITVTTEDGSKTADCTVTVQPSSSGVELIDPTDIRIYPNPARDRLIIEHATAKHVIIYAADGQKVYENPNLSGKEIISISNWHTGLYLVKIQTDKGAVWIEKVVKE